MRRELQNSSYTSCRLPSTFVGYCSEKYGLRIPMPCDLVSYHTTCTGNATKKLELAHAILKATEACPKVERMRHSTRLLAPGHCCRNPELEIPPDLATDEPPLFRHGWFRKHRVVKQLPKQAYGIEFCENACLQQPECRFFSFSSSQAASAQTSRKEDTHISTLRRFCNLCTHCSGRTLGGSYESWMMRPQRGMPTIGR